METVNIPKVLVITFSSYISPTLPLDQIIRIYSTRTPKSANVENTLHQYTAKRFREYVCWNISSGAVADYDVLSTNYISVIAVRYLNMCVPSIN